MNARTEESQTPDAEAADSSRQTPDAFARHAYWLLPLVAALGVAWHAPSLTIGFVGDDYTHQFILERGSAHTSLRPWNLYDFGTHPYPWETRSIWWENGGLPWWTQPDWKLRFFRPLTSLTIWLDHSLYGDWAPGYKLTSLVWYTALLILVYGLYRALDLSKGTALLALVLFAVAECSLMPVGWVANRNSLLAVFFMAASVMAISRHRVWGSGPALAGALALAGLACLAKESGIAGFALLLVYLQWARHRSEDRISRGWAATGSAASLLLAGLYLLFLALSGYGARTLYYPTPWGDPGEFLTRVVTFLPAGLCHLLGPFAMRDLLSHPYVALPVVLLFTWVLWKELKAVPAARFFAAWIVLTVLPQAAGKPDDRLLFGAAVGSSALLALLVTSFLSHPPAGRRHWGYRVLAIAILFYAGGLSGSELIKGWADESHKAQERRRIITTADVGSPELGRREAFILQSPHTGLALVPISTWAVETSDAEVRFWPMQMSRRALRWTRLDERSFELETLDEPFLTRSLEELFLSSRAEPPPDTTWETALFTVEGAGFEAGRLRRFRVRCPQSLDNPGYRFLTFRDGRFVAIPPPSVGQSLVLEAIVRKP